MLKFVNYNILNITVGHFTFGPFWSFLFASGPFWTSAWAVLVIQNGPIGAVLDLSHGPFFDIRVGRFGFGPFWSFPVACTDLHVVLQ